MLVGGSLRQVHPIDDWSLDAASGRTNWRRRYDALSVLDSFPVASAVGARWGVVGHPDGRLTRIDLATGSRVLSARRFLPVTGNGRRDGIRAVGVSGDTIFVAEVAPSPRGLRFGLLTLWQLDAATGDSLLATRMPDDTTTADEWLEVYRDLVIAPSATRLGWLAFERATGRVRWFLAPDIPGAMSSTRPIFFRDTMWVAGWDLTVSAVDPASGRTLWRARGLSGSLSGGIVLCRDRIYATDDRTTYLIDRPSGRVVRQVFGRPDVTAQGPDSPTAGGARAGDIAVFPLRDFIAGLECPAP
jgi:outer membrane protein assembly factor BamB